MAAAGPIDGISASDLFAQHAYVQTGAGIYYGTANPGGFTLNYVPANDSASVFMALATGLRPYTPGIPPMPGQGWPGTASADVGAFGFAGASGGQGGGSNACGASCGAWGGTPAPSGTQDASSVSYAGALAPQDRTSGPSGAGSSGSYGFSAAGISDFFTSSGADFTTAYIQAAPAILVAAPEPASVTLALSGLAGLLLLGRSRIRRDAAVKRGDGASRTD